MEASSSIGSSSALHARTHARISNRLRSDSLVSRLRNERKWLKAIHWQNFVCYSRFSMSLKKIKYMGSVTKTIHKMSTLFKVKAISVMICFCIPQKKNDTVGWIWPPDFEFDTFNPLPFYTGPTPLSGGQSQITDIFIASNPNFLLLCWFLFFFLFNTSDIV